MPKPGTRIESSFNTNKGAEPTSAESADVKFIKKIQPPAGTALGTDAKPANRPPRMGGCIPVSG